MTYAGCDCTSSQQDRLNRRVWVNWTTWIGNKTNENIETEEENEQEKMY